MELRSNLIRCQAFQEGALVYSLTEQIDYIISKMQFPGTGSSSSHPSIFESILEECSVKAIEEEEQMHLAGYQQPQSRELLQDHVEPQSSHMWMWLDQTPYQSIVEQNEITKADKNCEFHRVKSLREEQETKITQFLRDDKYKSLRVIIPLGKNSSPVKTSLSLSPRKTKRIDKVKPFRLIHESD